MMRRVLLALFSLSLTAGAAVAAPDNYLTDVLKQPAYAKSIARLFEGAKELPPWTQQILKRSGDYANSPATYATIEKARYQLNNACQEHDCIDNQIEIMFAPGGNRAWGALIVDSKPVVYLGSPSPAQRDAMKNAIAAYDPWVK